MDTKREKCRIICIKSQSQEMAWTPFIVFSCSENALVAHVYVVILIYFFL